MEKLLGQGGEAGAGGQLVIGQHFRGLEPIVPSPEPILLSHMFTPNGAAFPRKLPNPCRLHRSEQHQP